MPKAVLVTSRLPPGIAVECTQATKGWGSAESDNEISRQPQFWDLELLKTSLNQVQLLLSHKVEKLANIFTEPLSIFSSNSEEK